jgi:hypothetical protein
MPHPNSMTRKEIDEGLQGAQANFDDDEDFLAFSFQGELVCQLTMFNRAEITERIANFMQSKGLLLPAIYDTLSPN